MRGTVTGLLLFLVCFGFHVMLWRLKVGPRNHIRVVKIFATGLVVFVLFTPAFLFDLGTFNFFPRDCIQYIHALLLFAGLSSAYIFFYPGIEFDSPSNKIFMSLFWAKDGLSVSTVRNLVTDQDAVGQRVNELMASGKIKEESGRLLISSEGRRFSKIFAIFNAIYRTTR